MAKDALDLFGYEPPSDTKSRLIQATLAEIERCGLGRVTVRGVAEAAAANVASVNYHFGSKEALLEQAQGSAIAHMLRDSQEVLRRLHEDPPFWAAELFYYYLEGSRRYPRLTKAQLYGPFVAEDYRGPFAEAFREILQKVRDSVQAVVPNLDAAAAAQRVIAAFSAVLFPTCFLPLFDALGALDSEDERKHYCAQVAESMYRPDPPPMPQ